jgi:hypothetical protein
MKTFGPEYAEEAMRRGEDCRVYEATETGEPPKTREGVGDRIITAKVRVLVPHPDGGSTMTDCYLYAEEYNSDDVLGCESCSDGDHAGPGCDKCENTGHSNANSFAVTLGTTPENAKEAHALGDDDHYTAPCWCANDEPLAERVEWLRFQAEDAGLVPFDGEDA